MFKIGNGCAISRLFNNNMLNGLHITLDEHNQKKRSMNDFQCPPTMFRCLMNILILRN